MTEPDPKREALVEYGRASIGEVYAEADAIAAEIASLVRARTGVRLPTGRPSVMDASRAQLGEAAYRAQHALEAMKLIRGWFWPNDVPTLGEFVRGLPEDVREQIAEHLVEAGLS